MVGVGVRVVPVKNASVLQPKHMQKDIPVQYGVEELGLGKVLEISVTRIEIHAFKLHGAVFLSKPSHLPSNMPLQLHWNKFLGAAIVHSDTHIGGSLHRVGKQLLAQSSKLDSLEKF